jgi:hypothetical protein
MHFYIPKHVPEYLIPYLRERRVHHQDEAGPAIGIEVVPIERPVMSAETAGKKYPIAIPAAMARKIQSVRYVSVKENCLTSISVWSSNSALSEFPLKDCN